jgi:hypothetical protein
VGPERAFAKVVDDLYNAACLFANPKDKDEFLSSVSDFLITHESKAATMNELFGVIWI